MLQQLGWEFWLMGVTAIAATVLTALRTGTAFFVAAVGQISDEIAVAMSKTGGYAEATAAIFAYEGLLLGIGAMDGQRRYRKALAAARAKGVPLDEVVVELNEKFKWSSVALALLTSVMAGGAVSANLMAFASVLAFTTGEMLGMLSEEAKVKADLAHTDYDKELAQWAEGREAYWIKNRKRFMRRIDPDLVAELDAARKEGTQQQPAAQPARPAPTVPQAAEVLAWYLKRHPDVSVQGQISAKEMAEEAFGEANKGTDTLLTDKRDINDLAASLRMAVSRERKGASVGNVNGIGHDS